MGLYDCARTSSSGIMPYNAVAKLPLIFTLRGNTHIGSVELHLYRELIPISSRYVLRKLLPRPIPRSIFPQSVLQTDSSFNSKRRWRNDVPVFLLFHVCFPDMTSESDVSVSSSISVAQPHFPVYLRPGCAIVSHQSPYKPFLSPRVSPSAQYVRSRLVLSGCLGQILSGGFCSIPAHHPAHPRADRRD